MQNPFSLNFGAVPTLYIPRREEQKAIIDDFMSEIPSSNIYMILGVRGSGKTVLMKATAKKLAQEKNWLHIDLNAELPLLPALAAELEKSLGSRSRVKAEMRGEIMLTSLGISVEGKENAYAALQSDIDEMLQKLKKKNKRILITIDEAANSENMRAFTTAFQHFIRAELPVFLIMTGLYKNIRALQNAKSQTFLRRAPRVTLKAISLLRIAAEYADVFEIDRDRAMVLAKHTNGYSYAFQLLGYLLTSRKKTDVTDSILLEYIATLEEASYEKIWEELSPGEKRVAMAAASLEHPTSQNIREALDLDANTLSTYKDTLSKSGLLVTGVDYGSIRFALPYFKDFLTTKYYELYE